MSDKDVYKSLNDPVDRYQKGQKMSFEIEFEYNRRAQNYSAPPPEILAYAQAAYSASSPNSTQVVLRNFGRIGL